MSEQFRARTGTYSIVAIDPTGAEMGIAVQTHWFAVGGIVPWTEPGVGVVATQANVNVAYGPLGLGRLRDGLDASETVTRLVGADPEAAGRQLAVLDARGSVATFTGPECFAFAGHEAGDGWSCQANLMASPDVWPAMARAFAAITGPLAERLIASLHAGEAAGGDVRGRQSAAVEVVPVSREPAGHIVSLRVDDHPDPLRELDRLYALHSAYDLAAQADAALGRGDHRGASELYEQASGLAPDNDELLFWAGLGAAQSGRLDVGVDRVRKAIVRHAGWADLLERLPEHAFPSVQLVRRLLIGADAGLGHDTE